MIISTVPGYAFDIPSANKPVPCKAVHRPDEHSQIETESVQFVCGCRCTSSDKYRTGSPHRSSGRFHIFRLRSEAKQYLRAGDGLLYKPFAVARIVQRFIIPFSRREQNGSDGQQTSKIGLLITLGGTMGAAFRLVFLESPKSWFFGTVLPSIYDVTDCILGAPGTGNRSDL